MKERKDLMVFEQRNLLQLTSYMLEALFTNTEQN